MGLRGRVDRHDVLIEELQRWEQQRDLERVEIVERLVDKGQNATECETRGWRYV